MEKVIWVRLTSREILSASRIGAGILEVLVVARTAATEVSRSMAWPAET
jgi:hypothetical protein